MTAPNIVSVSSIYGKSVGYIATNSLASTGVANAASSNTLLKVNSVTATNTDSSTRTVSITLLKDNSTDYYLARNVSLSAGATVVLLNRSDNPLYLEENDSLRAIASVGSVVHLVINYEEIS